MLDPPWPERGGGKIKRGADRHYPLMSIKDIIALPVGKIADDNAHMYLWVTNNFLKDGLDCMEAWGFRYVTMITWMKGKCSLDQLKYDLRIEDEVELYSMGYSSCEIAKILGISDWSVRDKLRKKGIVLFPRGKRLNQESVSIRQLEVLNGEMLGDGCISLRKRYKNAYLEWHLKRMGHVQLLCDEFENLEPSFHSRYDDEDGWKLWTKCNPDLTNQHNRWYPNGVKIVPKDLELTPLVCYHWYIGDGYFGKSNNIDLYSLGFSKEENIFLIKLLSGLGINAVLRETNKYPSGTKYFIALGKFEAKKFLEYIGPCTVEDYNYKWPDNDEELIVTPGNISLGQYFRGLTEHCLFGVKGRIPYQVDDNGKRQQGKTGFIAPRHEHSVKPKQMREMIEKVTPGPRIELFSRQDIFGWDHLGNALDGKDIRQQLEAIIKGDDAAVVNGTQKEVKEIDLFEEES